jgi:preprotein translocase subunit SecA
MDYLQEGIGLRAMAQRDPLVEYQREGFDMFAAMMDGVKEESVGFLFNLEVQVDEEQAAGEEAPAIAPAGPVESDGEPQLDVSLLKSAQEQHESAPHIKAKGLDRSKDERPLTYSAPELGSDAPSVQTGEAAKAGATSGSATARRQQARSSNPNRGSRGNKSNANRNKRKK